MNANQKLVALIDEINAVMFDALPYLNNRQLADKMQDIRNGKLVAARKLLEREKYTVNMTESEWVKNGGAL